MHFRKYSAARWIQRICMQVYIIKYYHYLPLTVLFYHYITLNNSYFRIIRP